MQMLFAACVARQDSMRKAPCEGSKLCCQGDQALHSETPRRQAVRALQSTVRDVPLCEVPEEKRKASEASARGVSMTDKSPWEALGELGADFIKEQLARPSALGKLFTALPSKPYDLAYDGEHTHYAWFVLENTRYVRACDGEHATIMVGAADAPTCLQCARLA
jgi:hypothetical protein